MKEQVGGNKCPDCGFNTYFKDLGDNENYTFGYWCGNRFIYHFWL